MNTLRQAINKIKEVARENFDCCEQHMVEIIVDPSELPCSSITIIFKKNDLNYKITEIYK